MHNRGREVYFCTSAPSAMHLKDVFFFFIKSGINVRASTDRMTVRNLMVYIM